MGAISDNISNVNTIGYKGTQVNFQTLVTSQTSSTEYSPGGVQSKPRSGIDVQGLLQASTSSTDVALSGSGFFIVNSSANPTVEGGQFGYTRAGSFKPDKNGYLSNASGFYLQGWPLTPSDGSAAAAPGAEVINGNTYMKAYESGTTTHYINQNIVSTTEMQPLNVNAIGGTAQASTSVSMAANLPSGDPVYDPTNATAGGTHNTNILLYDSLGNTHNAQFSWTKTAANDWSLGVTPPDGSAVATVTNYTSSVPPTNQVYASAGQLQFTKLPPVGSYVTIGGVKVQFLDSSVAALPVPAMNDATKTISIDMKGMAASGTSDLVKSMVTSLRGAASDPLTYPTMAPLLNGGLADGGNRFAQSSGTLMITQEPGATSIDVNATSNTTTMLGDAVVQSGAGMGSGNSPAGLFTVAAIDPAYRATTLSPIAPASFTMSATPTGNLVVGATSVPWATIVAAATAPVTTTTISAAAVAYINGLPAATTGGVKASSSGNVLTITSPSSAAAKNIPIKLNSGGATTELVSASLDATSTILFGQKGTYDSTNGNAIAFNGDGTPAKIIPNTMSVVWANGSEDQLSNTPTGPEKPWITLSLGHIGQADGLTQLGGSYQVNTLTQNGAKFGNFSGVTIGSDGIVTALFDNGVRAPVFQIPIATFANPDGMSALTGNVWIDTTTSGSYTVRQPGEAGSGTVAAASLESSTVDLGTEFTTMIVVQRAYSASAKIITTADSMLDELLSIKR
jgi:flagellar hook protein FlgE